ncbi:hypothetical protein IWZ03DRAFT_235351 [Phyllosticta citriasiana]|uniref:Uncharacterized protein n=1 Tax=Phyllosticta citriasiana TaxID=595635 RepID=A0ABR1KK12_9PEZI
MMHSIILDPATHPDPENEEYDWVDVTDSETLVDSTSVDNDDDDDDDEKPGKDGDDKKKRQRKRTRGSKTQMTSSGAQDDDHVRHAATDTKPSNRKHKSFSPSSSSWTTTTTQSDPIADTKRTESKWASLFNLGKVVSEEEEQGNEEESEDYEHIEESEADAGARGSSEREARMEKARALLRRKEELRRSAPAPGMVNCPCVTGGEDGWEKCRDPAHRELGRLTNMS